MGLNSALVDRARRVYVAPTPTKVDGTTRFETIHGPWFRMRLSFHPASTTEASARSRARLTDDGGARTRAVERPTLIFGIKDLDGGSLLAADGRCVLTAQDRIEIDSPQLGRHLYEIIEEPSPMRKKRKILGYTVAVSRVVDHEFTPAV